MINHGMAFFWWKTHKSRSRKLREPQSMAAISMVVMNTYDLSFCEVWNLQTFGSRVPENNLAAGLNLDEPIC